jgi:hypothetical protein
MPETKLDVAGSLYTHEYLETHIKGKQAHAKDLTGTGSVSEAPPCIGRHAGATVGVFDHIDPQPWSPLQCFDATRMSPQRAGMQQPLAVQGSSKAQEPKWCRATMSYKCAPAAVPVHPLALPCRG